MYYLKCSLTIEMVSEHLIVRTLIKPFLAMSKIAFPAFVLVYVPGGVLIGRLSVVLSLATRVGPLPS